MNKEKQILEMATIMCGNDCEECARESAEFHKQTIEEARNINCLLKNCAKELCNAGYRKINENEIVISKEKYILANKVYTDTTLKGWKKEDLIEHIRILEHNWASAEESLNNQAKNCEMLLKQIRKETAREIYYWVKEHSTGVVGECLFKTFLKEKYGVEIKE